MTGLHGDCRGPWAEHPLLCLQCLWSAPQAGCAWGTYLCLELPVLFSVYLLRHFSHLPCSSQTPGTRRQRGVWRSHPAESQWMCWAAGHGAEPEGLAASLLERSSCSEHRGVVLEQLTLRKCWKAPAGEMKANLWAFIWRFPHCLCAEESLLQPHIIAQSIIRTDPGKSVFLK